MAFKFVSAFALVAVVSAGLAPAPQVYHAAPQFYNAAPQLYQAAPAVVKTYAAPAAVVKTHYAAPVAYAAQPVLAKAHEEYDPHPQYKYAYDVQDSISGDSKNQVEERDGDVVRGEYSLNDADGFRRTVQYTADPINGFNAVVHREPLVKAVAVKAVAPVTYAAPVAHYAAPAAVVKSVAPVTYAAPFAHYAAPVARYAAPAAVVKTVAPVAHYGAPAYVKNIAPAYATYNAPAAYGPHHY